MPDKAHELEVVFDHYALRLPGGYGNRKISCPTLGHDDRHASASVNTSMGLWNCHACGRGGTAIDLIMDREEMDYARARRHLDDLLGGGDQRLPGEPGLLSRGDGVPRRPGPGRARRPYQPPWSLLDAATGA